ncbi:MAG: hypothetical protein QGF30_06010 [Alphaproteobacteria bacterium]|nr:hypothetical protein [Alphaproteobacteria bacterium]
MINFPTDGSWHGGWLHAGMVFLVVGCFVFSMFCTGNTGAREAESDPVWSPQLRPPVKLVPPPGVREPEEGKESPPSDETEPGRAPGRKFGIQIETDMLQAIDQDSFGVLEADQGGFGIEMWSGSDRRIVEWLLPKLPVTAHSRVMRDLMRRLLLSNATAPQGASDGPSLISLRISGLMAMGDMEAVESLLAMAPVHLDDEALLRAQVNNLFLVNDSAEACPNIRTAIRKSQDIFWQKGLIFCQVLSGEHDRAVLGVDLMREQGMDADSVFFRLVGSLLGEWEGRIDSLSDPTALQLAMARAGNMRLPGDVTQTRNPALLAAIAISPNADPEIRLAAAEKAESAGTLSTESLRQIYASIEFTSEELESALTTAEAIDGPRGRALLLRTAQVQDVPTAQAEVLLAFLASARDSGLYETAAYVIAPTLVEMAPAAELIWFAEEAGRVLIFTGALEQAMGWYDLAEQESAGIPEAGQAKARLWPLILISDPGEPTPLDGAMTEAWMKQDAVVSPTPQEGSVEFSAAAANAGPEAEYRVDMLLGLLDAVGNPVDISIWEGRTQQAAVIGDNTLENVSLPAPALPSPVLWYGLRVAAEELRLGETILFALVSLGHDGLDRVNPITMNEVISRLRLVGLDTESRALALEAAIAAGL